MTIPKKRETPLLDLAIRGKEIAKQLSLRVDTIHPLIVLNEQMRAEIRRIIKEEENVKI